MVADKYKALLQEVELYSKTATLIAVSKGRPASEIQELYDLGCRHFGENRLDEVFAKKEALPGDIQWHMIGALQRKKVPQVIGQFALIHSVDSFALAEKISQVSERERVTTAILLQVNTSGEATKQGLSPEEWEKYFPLLQTLPALSLQGLMTMAPLTEDTNLIRSTFSSLRKCRDRWKVGSILSMGMSHDWKIALEEGATHLRIGSRIFLPY